MKPRIGIRGQLIALVSIIVLVALAILSVPVWVYVNNFTTGVQLQSLSLTASLKAARIASEIDLLQTLCETISTRLLLQESLQNFYAHNSSQPNDVFGPARNDLLSALSGGGYAGLFQARLYSRNSTGDPHGLVNVTGNGVGEKEDNIPLPYLTPDGRRANLSADEVWGYPPMLFPNITYVSLGFPNPDYRETGAFAAMAFPHVSLPTSGGMLLGPLIINSTYALISLTIPVRSNSVPELILGYLTLVASSASIVEVQTSAEGLGSSASVLIIGPTNPWNRFDSALPASNETWTPPLNAFAGTPVQYLLPPATPAGYPDRHPHHDFASGDYDNPWPVTDYPAALDVFSSRHNVPNNATAVLSTTNEEGVSVAAGAARPQSTLVTWAVIVEQAESEALGPPRTLRKIILACVFGTLGLVLLLVVPCAHISVLPIRRLKEATERSMAPPGYEDEIGDDFDEEDPSSSGRISEKGLVAYVRRRIRRGRRATARAAMAAETRRRHFKIPARVELKKHLVTDELTELTETFNRMTEELLKQYTSLDDKVAERTRELEISKKAAEAANESKTLFIANISHELKTPLNGIMGMAAVCMEEDDIVKIKQSLKTLYKSGDLLLHLLEDLLSFSKNQIGQQISLEEKEFRLGDIRSQLLSIFDKQVRESGTTFSVDFVGWENAGVGQSPSPSPSPERVSIDKMLPALGPPGVGRLRDMCVWGDQHRILQVIINLASNSLKFTPAGGKVDLRIRCLGQTEAVDESRASSLSKSGSNRPRPGRPRARFTSGATTHSASSQAASASGTAISSTPVDRKPTSQVYVRERSMTPPPPPPNAKTYTFEFEVEDTGPGIAAHMQQKIFEPFVQADLGLSRKYGGSGLGLSIVSQLVSIMGGNISLRSEVGVGTAFTVRIPLKYTKDRASSTASSSTKSRPPSVGSAETETFRKPAVEPKTSPTAVLDQQPRLVGLSQPFFSPQPSARPSREDQLAAIDRAMVNKACQGKLRVLVADDNSTNIEVVSRLLKLEDIYDVAIAKDGQEAYDLVKTKMQLNQQFDVIFMDIQMPNLDGLQSTRLIRQMGYSAPIVALTAFSEDSNVKECMEVGMDEFLSKPIRRPALKKVLKKFATIPEEPEPTGKTPPLPPADEADTNGSAGAPKQQAKATVTVTAAAAETEAHGTASPPPREDVPPAPAPAPAPDDVRVDS